MEKRSFLKLILALALLPVCSAHATHRSPTTETRTADFCQRALGDPGLALCYDPEEALARSGFRLDSIRLSTDLPGAGAKLGGQHFSVKVSYGEDAIGELIAGRLRKLPAFVEVVYAKIRDARYKQRGLGTLMYLTYAKLLWERHQLRLTPDDEQSDDARALWSSFAKKGWTATDPETGRIFLRPEVLTAPAGDRLGRFMEKSGLGKGRP